MMMTAQRIAAEINHINQEFVSTCTYSAPAHCIHNKLCAAVLFEADLSAGMDLGDAHCTTPRND